MRRKFAIDLRDVGCSDCSYSDRKRVFVQWFIFQKSDLRGIELLAGRSEPQPEGCAATAASAADHQLEKHQFGISLLDHSQ